MSGVLEFIGLFILAHVILFGVIAFLLDAFILNWLCPKEQKRRFWHRFF